MKEEFPALQAITYLDTAASAQKPLRVLNAELEFSAGSYANVHRSMHKLSEAATQAFEAARHTTAAFLKGRPEEVVFTSGTTESMNLLAHSLPLKKGDRVITTLLDHHSTFVPFQQAALRTQAEFVVIGLTKDGALDMTQAKKEIAKGCAVLAVTQLSNVTGEVVDVATLAKWVHAEQGVIVIDGAQAAAHVPLNIKELGVDAYAFSGHKVYGPNGIGALWVRSELLETLSPYKFGGEMISEVTVEKTTFQNPPARFEAGTPPITQAVGLSAALRFVAEHRDLIAKEEDLISYCVERLQELPVRIIGPAEKTGCVSFVLDDVHAHDVAQFLDTKDVAVRAGHHCNQPLHDHLRITASARASFGLYNTTEDVDTFIDALKECVEVFDV